MPRKRKGRCVKRNKQINVGEKEELVKAPHSFVFHRGLPGDHIVELTKDFRKIMEPFTASSLKARKKNTIKDFVSVASVLHVSHMCIFTKTELGMYLKLCKLPRGPTLTFKIHSFSLARDVISMLKKQLVYEEAFKSSPLLILNNFSGEGMQLKLIASTFQNMFPTINLTTVNLSTIRRCICLNYNTTSKTIDFRHYAIKVVPIGLSRGVKKLVQAKIPNLSKCQDISDFLTKPTMSESEAEDDENSHVTLSQKLSSRGNHANSKSAIRLSELGPRITLQLIKVENGLLDGEILFHEFIHKTEEEKLAIKKKREEKKKLKEKRKKIQEENKKKKEAQKQEHKEKSLKGIQKKKENNMLLQKIAKESIEQSQLEDDDDVQYYREEVGEEPDKDLFQTKVGTKRPHKHIMRYKPKKAKFDTS
ncbi:protein Peter pan [Pogonomyrmex barbatus]|uniref:Protein Peter pan n=1 Tax=Pogonomyrmex barbatus TaxID=144034 RepID=A0A6I9W4M9_9HYME|nr:protein Peter pan [Pogonomyrmex barbatus]XP_011636324.1 protein Peter pan [Pogonomyrmex barbatus]XP_011636325.1 protein Peter pan [Pogonomyrmex barbatus]